MSTWWGPTQAVSRSIVCLLLLEDTTRLNVLHNSVWKVEICIEVQANGSEGWHQLDLDAAAPEARGWFAAAMLPDGLLIHGGVTESNERLDDLWKLNLHDKG